MKKFLKILAGVLASVSVLTSCSGTLVNLTYKDGQFKNDRLDLAYTPAPSNYQPVSVGKAYAYYEEMDMTLYEIIGLDKKDWLTEDLSSGAASIFYSDDVTLPTLEEMNPTEIFVCSNTEVIFALATIEDKEIIDALIDVFVNGEECEWPIIDSIATYDMKFHSEELYPHLYYSLIYGEFSSGKYLYDRNTKRCVNIGTILDDDLTS